MLNKLNFWNVIGSRCQNANKKLRVNFTLNFTLQHDMKEQRDSRGTAIHFL